MVASVSTVIPLRRKASCACAIDQWSLSALIVMLLAGMAINQRRNLLHQIGLA
jgi:hypothetical protein